MSNIEIKCVSLYQKAVQVTALIQNGLIHRDISGKLGMTRVKSVQTGSFNGRSATGRKQGTTARDNRSIVTILLSNRHRNAVHVQQ